MHVRIAHLDLGPRPLLLAPMEDVSDPPFRLLCKRYGADLVYTEFISAGGLVYEADSSLQKLDIYDEERPVGIQIFGGDEDQVRHAARVVDAVGPDLVDINFGCPVKKVVCHDGGAGILRNLPKMERLTRAVIEETKLPVTVKTRLGWSDDTIQILDVARMLQDAGISALAVHARTRSQQYTGKARWDWLRRIRDEVDLRIPLIGNGDADSPENIQRMFDETGVDAVMIGRGAIGNPWIFNAAKAYMATGEVPPPPSWDERVEVAAEHLTLKCEWLGERKGVLEMRRMYGSYFKGYPGASKLRQQLMSVTELHPALEVLRNCSETDLRTMAQVSLPKAVKPVALPRLAKPLSAYAPLDACEVGVVADE